MMKIKCNELFSSKDPIKYVQSDNRLEPIIEEEIGEVVEVLPKSGR